MDRCARCGDEWMRVHRTATERLLFETALQCRNCRRRVRRLYPGFLAWLQYTFSFRTHCPKCGSADVVRRSKRDKVEGSVYNPLAVICRLTGAPLRYCESCRVQYNDWRP